jgi:hypothetical protein
VATARLDKQLLALDRKVGSEVREPALRIGGRTLAPGAKGGAGGAGTGSASGAVPVELVAGRPGRVIDRAGAEAALLAAAAAPVGATVGYDRERPPTVAPRLPRPPPTVPPPCSARRSR